MTEPSGTDARLDRIEALEAKLAKAKRALERAKASIESGGGGGVTDVVWLDDPCPETLCDFIDAALAAIRARKGGDMNIQKGNPEMKPLVYPQYDTRVLVDMLCDQRSHDERASILRALKSLRDNERAAAAEMEHLSGVAHCAPSAQS